MFTARMTTSHYTFEAAGLTEKDAKQALLVGWRKHLREGIAHYRGREDTSAMEKSLKMSLAELEDWYGIHTFKCEPGVCLRDGFRI